MSSVNELSTDIKKDLKVSKDAETTKPKEDNNPNAYNRWSLVDETTIDYGYFNSGHSPTITTKPPPPPTNSKESYYITTAINYANGPAHIGHAYEAVTSDAFARYHRIRLNSSSSVLFVTGADEHGQKIAATAEREGVSPIELCDRYVKGFQVLNQRLLISPDDYIRTTSERHKWTARALWERCVKNCGVDGKGTESDIYLDSYSGWYNVREETFVTDSDAQLTNYLDVDSGQPLKKVEEESYFFRMSAYHDKLLEYIEAHPEFIQPTWHRNQVKARLQKDRLRDLSISRTTFDWGIPVPSKKSDNTTSDETEARHVMYVWFDALTNYLTAVDGLSNPDASPETQSKRPFWPASVHIIGKDISWFHTVIWPTILLSANLPLPRTVYAHGFVNDGEGKKMSKSLGNIVNPHDMLDLYTVDTFRYYLCREAPYGADLSFSEASMGLCHDSDLCDTVGNLIHRATNLCGAYCGGIIPDVEVDKTETTAKLDWGALLKDYQAKMDAFELQAGCAVVMKGFRDVNGYLTEREPWHKKGPEFAEERKIIVRTTLEAVYALSVLLLPFIPNGASEIFSKLGTDPVGLDILDDGLRNLKAGTKVVVGKVLYTKIGQGEEKSKDAKGKGKGKATLSYEEAKEKKRLAKLKANEASKVGQKNSKGAAADVNQPEFTKMDIRVGLITKIWNHPNADRLFCEEIDVGEESGGKREITSGLRGHYELGDLEGKKVLVVCNLKASKIVGFSSNGMVLAAKSEDGTKVELVTPPDDAKVGERVFIEGLEGNPFSSAQVKKKKTWVAVAKELKTGPGGVAMWSGKDIMTSAGKCSAASLVGVPFS